MLDRAGVFRAASPLIPCGTLSISVHWCAGIASIVHEETSGQRSIKKKHVMQTIEMEMRVREDGELEHSQKWQKIEHDNECI